MPYLDVSGNEITVRFRLRTALTGGEVQSWRKAAPVRAVPPRARARGRLLAPRRGRVRRADLWLHGFPALGLPGAANWKAAWDAPHLDGIAAVYVLSSPTGEARR